MNLRFFFRRAFARSLFAAALAPVAALQTGCTLVPNLSGDREVQAAVEKAANDPFPSAKQVGLAANEAK
jgi:hypothetical protein